MTSTRVFEKTKRSTIKRAPEYADYSEQAVYDILDSGYMCTIAFVLDGKPFLNPTLYWRKGNYVYWHGLAGSKMLLEQAKKIDVCFNVSHLDGLLLGRSAFHHSVNYRSVTIHGKSELVEDSNEKMDVAFEFVETLFPGRRSELREHKEEEIQKVKFMRLPIEEVSVKHRYDNSVMDILRRQQSNALKEYGPEGVNPHCWTGTIPIRTILETPIPDTATDPNIHSPDYLSQSKFKREF
ncbi:Pyridoxamine 5'-phosphate oxidase [Pseudovibrio sp. Ad46]|uniref:pyridoxamine 5'-phosphate oxidase family protein n=1 Tax=unclassified Pseudovibrio TaxID=2627060 RepID=UPI0007B25FC0|nr:MULTISPECIES: pyridoxamine 5'-phosphate oxidase family protein [unclassified Pseudovibrio]KZK92972.1 Pyridoxamine 5'-phosphate oxidase [Pseudovibrio sp. Ad46]KZK96650.1 Pyridoxamine 5'-phosphate oxidase [Pseudovibrio sp. Ad5]